MKRKKKESGRVCCKGQDKEGSAPLGGEGGAARPPSKAAHPAGGEAYRSDGYRYVRPHGYEIKRKAVQLYVEEGLSAELVSSELGISRGCVFEWVRQYRESGENGLKPKPYGVRTLNKLSAVKEKITAIKRLNPHFGVKRISQVLRRIFFLKAAPETVRQHLKKTQVVTPKAKARKKPKAPERRFEASTPNQMWQGDITYYRILGATAYIIGFVDDNSRYVTGLGVYRSQPGEYVVDVYREAVAQFGVPREMLTDNGRQYASWRGKTKFQKELAKDHVHHIRSRPQHPQTLGKIERFWQTLKNEFLERARFETFEEARERIAYWVKYYNHKRPHQSLEGLTPADRFFSIQKEVKEAIERQMAANVEELALRGRPVEPFYMVGRVGKKSVVIETDKKRVSVRVDGHEMEDGEAMEYEMGGDNETGTIGLDGREKEAEADIQCAGKKPGGAGTVERAAERIGADERNEGCLGSVERVGETSAHGDAYGAGSDVATAGREGNAPAGAGGETHGKDTETGAGEGSAGGGVKEGQKHEDIGTGQVCGGGKMPCGAGGVDGTEERIGTLQGTGDKPIPSFPVAGSCDVGYVGCLGTARSEGGEGRVSTAGAGQAAAGTESAHEGIAGRGTERAFAIGAGEEESAGGIPRCCRSFLNKEVNGLERGTGGENGRTAEGDPGTSGGAEDSHGIGDRTGDKQEDVLRVAGTGDGSHALCVDGPAWRASAESCGRREGTVEDGSEGAGEGEAGSGGSVEDPGGSPADFGKTASEGIGA